MTTLDDDRRTLMRTYRAATWLAALAYPEDGRLRGSFAGAIIACRFDLAPVGTDPAYEATRLASLAQDRKYVAKEIDRGTRVINEERLEAAYMAWPKVCEAFRLARGCNPIADVPTHASSRMLDVVGSHRARKRANRSGKVVSGGDDPANVLARVWKPSLPVLHMAISLFISSDDKGNTIDRFFNDDLWFEEIAASAEVIRAQVAALFPIRHQWPDIPATQADMSKISPRDEIPAAHGNA